MFNSPGTRAGRGESLGFFRKALTRMLGLPRGSVLFQGANGLTYLAPGTAGQFMQTGGPGADPSFSSGVFGVTTGLDKNRPAASPVSAFIATDSGSFYLADGTIVRNFNLPEKSGWGGFSDSNYMQSQSAGASVGPLMTNPYTIFFQITLASQPGAVVQVILGFNNASTDGWYVATSSVNANKLAFFNAGLNGAAYNQFSGMTALTAATHMIAISWDGTNLKLVADGGSAVNLTPSGSMTAPSASARVTLGRYSGGTGFAFTSGSISSLYGYASALSTADMQTLTGTPSSYFPGVITAAPAYVWTSKILTTILGWPIWGSAAPTDGTGNLNNLGTLQFKRY